ncbi:MAG: hypothetical protein ABMA25_08265 [Ilumatobacteraceae bacterium]
MELSRRRTGAARRGVLAALTVALFGSTLASCSYAPEYAVTLNADGHVQVEWCLETSATVHVRPDGAVLAASSGGGVGSGPFAVDLEATTADQWSPVGVPTFDDDTIIELWSGGYTEQAVRDSATTTSSVSPSSSPGTTAYVPQPPAPELTVRVGVLQQGSYWYDGEQHSRDAWLDQCSTDDDGAFGDVLVPLIGGAICFLIVIGVGIWAIISAVTGRAASRGR